MSKGLRYTESISQQTKPHSPHILLGAYLYPSLSHLAEPYILKDCTHFTISNIQLVQVILACR